MQCKQHTQYISRTLYNIDLPGNVSIKLNNKYTLCT